MKCEQVQQAIPLAVYGELPDDEFLALEQHLSTCSRCREEFESVRALQEAMAFTGLDEPSANLLARTRMRLEEALNRAPRKSWIVRAGESIAAGTVNLGRAPVAASGLLVLGIGLGGFFGYRSAPRFEPPSPVRLKEAASPGPIRIAEVRSIARDSNSASVEIHYYRLVPETLHGSLDNPQIRQLLLIGAQNPLNPDVQLDSVSLLADECGAGHQCEAGSIRKALLVALRYDKDPGARLKALDGLESYVAEDMRVRDAVLEALIGDPDPAVRSRAIELLQPVQADSSVREVLHSVASDDINPHIRTVSREVLDQLPQIQ